MLDWAATNHKNIVETRYLLTSIQFQEGWFTNNVICTFKTMAYLCRNSGYKILVIFLQIFNSCLKAFANSFLCSHGSGTLKKVMLNPSKLVSEVKSLRMEQKEILFFNLC